MQNWTNDHAKLIGRIIFAGILTLPLKKYRNIIKEAEDSKLFRQIPVTIKSLNESHHTWEDEKNKSSVIIAKIEKIGNSFAIRYTCEGFNKKYLIDELFWERSCVDSSIRSMLFRIRRISSRNELTHRIIKGLIKHQKKFLNTDNPVHLTPFSQVQLAYWINQGQKDSGFCSTWVSRLVNKLSVITPSGEERMLKSFFPTQKDTNKRLIKQILDRENEDIQSGKLKTPYTDNELRKIMEQQSSISRSSVNCYRKDMGIPPAKRRLSGYKYPPFSANFSQYYSLTKKSIQQNCPTVSGVYEFCVKNNNGIEYTHGAINVFYIGSAANIRKRLNNHLSRGNKNGSIKKHLEAHQCLFRCIEFPHAWKEKEKKLLELFFSTYGSLPISNKMRGQSAKGKI
ncbi:GIY-YIG nuclease family protein [bacterium]|nr:GIY-YIG nuclease family protein [bacterium]